VSDLVFRPAAGFKIDVERDEDTDVKVTATLSARRFVPRTRPIRLQTGGRDYRTARTPQWLTLRDAAVLTHFARHFGQTRHVLCDRRQPVADHGFRGANEADFQLQALSARHRRRAGLVHATDNPYTNLSKQRIPRPTRMPMAGRQLERYITLSLSRHNGHSSRG